MLATPVNSNQFLFPLGGQWLLDPNEVNGWGIIGPYDDTNTQDLGNVDQQQNEFSGGLVFPWGVRLLTFFAWYRISSSAAFPWGWRIIHQEKFVNSIDQTNFVLLDEVAANGGVGPRDEPTSRPHTTDIDFTQGGLVVPEIIPANNTVNLSVVSPTAEATNRFVQVMSGYFLFERSS